MKNILTIWFAVFAMNAFAQDNLPYQKPPQEIIDLVDVQLSPYVWMNDNQTQMVMLYRDMYKSIEELSQEELRLGGLRIDPKTNIGSRVTYFNKIEVKSVKNGTVNAVTGLPANARIANFSWSPNQSMMAFTNTSVDGVQLYVLDVNSAKAFRVSNAKLNANLGRPYQWNKDGKSLLVKVIPSNRKPLIDTKMAVPTGPTISVNDGKKAQNRTYQDLLKNPNDEFNFEQLALSEIHKITLKGESSLWLESDMYRGISISPNGEYVMVTTIEKPFSYLVTYRSFPYRKVVFTKEAKQVAMVNQVPLVEDLPQGFMACRTGKRNVMWRADKPANLVYAVALDGGDPAHEVEYRDEVFEWEFPFNNSATSMVKTINRFYDIDWGNESFAIVHDYWWNTRNTKSYVFNPSDANQTPKVLYDRNYQDKYSDPGSFVTERNQYGKSVLAINGSNVYLIGEGFTKDGQFPFLAKMNISNQKTTRLYTSKMDGKLEDLRDFTPKNNQLLVRIESKNEYPNYYFRDVKQDVLTQLTAFTNPFTSIENVHKEVITYNREDGLELTGTLYLPIGFDNSKSEKYPMILWAYPTEYKDKASAGQNTTNPNEFVFPYYGSPIYWVTRGYVVLDDASFPIVGEGEEEPNDTFRKQLVSNAKAAIDAVDKLGYIDRNKVAVGGHSYGAFMVANLLTHSDLFAAGIARSGAYNRTLTPFGFQSEERNYWEAPDVYYTMSPFMHAEKMKTPLLLIHGAADNNSGTYPMQSERYFNALKGLGATTRLVMLPKESHGYRAKESILHVLWEQDEWLEKYVKNRVME
ncbi:MAG: alpha/beta hydrolase family protein [Salibacteraceae bacterium]